MAKLGQICSISRWGWYVSLSQFTFQMLDCLLLAGFEYPYRPGRSPYVRIKYLTRCLGKLSYDRTNYFTFPCGVHWRHSASIYADITHEAFVVCL
jgi:hypothetical protein